MRTLRFRFWRNFLLLTLGAIVLSVQVSAQTWPFSNATYIVQVKKTAGKEFTDIFWFHLHESEPGDGHSVTLEVQCTQSISVTTCGNAPDDDVQFRYKVHGVAVSGWLSAPATFVLDITDADLAGVTTDGIHDVQVEVQGTDMNAYVPQCSYLHIERTSISTSTEVPICNQDDRYGHHGGNPLGNAMMGVSYVDSANRNFVAHPAVTDLEPWTEAPNLADLYIEPMQPLHSVAMLWWGEPPGTPSANLPFVRGMWNFNYMMADLLGSWGYTIDPAVDNNEFSQHPYPGNGLAGTKNFPFKDGGRGVSWVSPFITGSFRSDGDFVFVESGGPLRMMDSAGVVKTITGWQLTGGKDPIWFLKPLDTIRQNQTFKGTFTNGQYATASDWGFHTPTDVVSDPRDEDVLYVVGQADNVIWKVDVADWGTFNNVTVSVLAGDPNHTEGYVDHATGTSARFRAPISITFDENRTKLYVSDMFNNAIREVDPDTGATTTLFGDGPTFGQWLDDNGATDCGNVLGTQFCYNADENFTVGQGEVTAMEAGMGVEPDIYFPFAIRMRSDGMIVLDNFGFGRAVKINPTTGETSVLANLQTIDGGIQNSDRLSCCVSVGWRWLDVDKWGNSGPLDSVYWAVSVGGTPDGNPGDSRPNELLGWFPAAGGTSIWAAGQTPIARVSWGKATEANVAHYPWLIAVSPEGALLTSGIGQNGIQRIRKRRAADRYYAAAEQNAALAASGGALDNWTTGRDPGGWPPSLKFGGDGHNYLGFKDAWSIQDSDGDAQVLADFEVDTAFFSGAEEAAIVDYLRRTHGVVGSGGGEPPPTEPTPRGRRRLRR